MTIAIATTVITALVCFVIIIAAFLWECCKEWMG